jgi:nucleoside phosphorylase
MRRLVILALVVLSVGTVPGGPAGAAPRPCPPRLLVLSAYPGEIDKLLTTATIRETVTVDGKRFFVGKLAGNQVVMALSGIGLVNAEATTKIALAEFRCGSRPAFSGIVFSGVAGGRTNIGDVTVPGRWTADDGRTWYRADPRMLAAARTVKARGVDLAGTAPPGDAACVGIDPRLLELIEMPNEPRLMIGGDGKSADPFNGRAFPCVPGGGDVFGCEPCRAEPVVPDVPRFVAGAIPFVDPNFFLGYFESPTPSETDWVAEDMETAAVARLANANRIPFLAVRAMSDGMGDPLMLPGFPFQFFAYRQLAADNAATVTLAFLREWARRVRR